MSVASGYADIGRTVRSRSVRAYERLDAAFFAEESVAASELVTVLEVRGTRVARLDELASVWEPARFARSWAARWEQGLPYLRPYDVFDYLPIANQRLSIDRNRSIDDLVLRKGNLLQTCSGRNLGPSTYVDEHLSGFALSHDMLRIDIRDAELRLYVLAYLQTAIGKALLRRGRSGSVIDHVTVEDISGIRIPLLDDRSSSEVVSLMREAINLREHGRAQLRLVLGEAGADFPFANSEKKWTSWSIQARALSRRLDAAYYAPEVRAGREALRGAGGVRLGDLAKAALPVRYKRYYVGDGRGRPIVSGRQLLQAEPVNLRRVSDRSFRNSDDYEIRSGMTIFGAVGRSEGRQAWPALVTPQRDRWLASNDVMRLTPHAGVRPGAVWLGVASKQAQSQIKALSFGSVVDHMNPWDVEDVVVPKVNDSLASAAEEAWMKLGESTYLLGEGAALLQSMLEE